jgi:pimeloyl-ACP methyl ester carboxylesterase
MTRQVLFVQGGGARVHDEWDQKLVDSLRRELGPAWQVRYPRMPNEADPDYATWSAALRKELAGLDDGAIVVGHSIGGTTLINALAEHPPERTLGAVILVSAPFVYLFYGLADDTAPPAHAELYARAIPRARLVRLPGRDHQLNDDLREVAAVIVAEGG